MQICRLSHIITDVLTLSRCFDTYSERHGSMKHQNQLPVFHHMVYLALLSFTPKHVDFSSCATRFHTSLGTCFFNHFAIGTLPWPKRVLSSGGSLDIEICIFMIVK
jgi:hypothetical protein